MYDFFPDSWVILKVADPTTDSKQYFYKVLAGWSGGYLDGDSWRMNSGITSVEMEDDKYIFSGESGSRYYCHKDTYGLRLSTNGIYQKMKANFGDDVQLLDPDTNWLELV